MFTWTGGGGGGGGGGLVVECVCVSGRGVGGTIILLSKPCIFEGGGGGGGLAVVCVCVCRGGGEGCRRGL